MADGFWTLRPPGDPAVEAAPTPVPARVQERLSRAVAQKLAQGFEIESQSDQRTVLVRRPKRWLGVTMPGTETREIVSLDDQGRPTVRTQ